MINHMNSLLLLASVSYMVHLAFLFLGVGRIIDGN
jgi:hypothetical protein